MNKENLTTQQRNIRMNVRNFLLIATKEELELELKLSLQRNDQFRAECVQELIDEEN
jgi:hypothetical protein